MMKKLLLLILALLLLLPGCSGGHRLERTAQGDGYLDTKTKAVYLQLDIAFEPAMTGEVVGTYTDKKRDITVTLHEIPQLDPAKLLADEDRNVYCIADATPNAAEWQIETILVCDGDGISVERRRFTADQQSNTVKQIRDLWFEGQEADFLSLVEADKVYSIKLCSVAYPNLYYCFDFLYFEQGACYFYNAMSRRSVEVPAELVELMHVKTNGESN